MSVRSYPSFSFEIKEKLKSYTEHFEALILELNETLHYFNNLRDNVCLKKKGNKSTINNLLDLNSSLLRELFLDPL